MIELTRALVMSLEPTKPRSFYFGTGLSALPMAIVTPSVSSGIYDKAENPATVQHDGLEVPVRLYEWFKSPTKVEAIQLLANAETEPVYSNAAFERHKDGVLFYVKRNDKRRGYYSSIYRDIDDAAEDLQFLLEKIGGIETSLAGLLLNNWQRAFLYSQQNKGKRGGAE